MQCTMNPEKYPFGNILGEDKPRNFLPHHNSSLPNTCPCLSKRSVTGPIFLTNPPIISSGFTGLRNTILVVVQTFSSFFLLACVLWLAFLCTLSSYSSSLELFLWWPLQTDQSVLPLQRSKVHSDQFRLACLVCMMDRLLNPDFREPDRRTAIVNTLRMYLLHRHCRWNLCLSLFKGQKRIRIQISE